MAKIHNFERTYQIVHDFALRKSVCYVDILLLRLTQGTTTALWLFRKTGKTQIGIKKEMQRMSN